MFDAIVKEKRRTSFDGGNKGSPVRSLALLRRAGRGELDRLLEFLSFEPAKSSNANDTIPHSFSAMDPFRLLTQGANFHKKSALFKQKKPAADDDGDDLTGPAASTSRLDAPLPAALDFFNVGGARSADADGADNGKGKRKREDRQTEAGQSTPSSSLSVHTTARAAALLSAHHEPTSAPASSIYTWAGRLRHGLCRRMRARRRSAISRTWLSSRSIAARDS